MEATTLHFPILDSTNLYCKKHWTEFGPFAFVSCDHQTSGKGREERTWEDALGQNLLFSLCLKLDPMPEVGLLSLAPAIAVSAALEGLGVKEVSIKWPNDVYVKGRKIAGILLEGSYPTYVVIGCGVNLNQTEFGPCRVPPTSARLLLGKQVDVKRFKEEVYAKLLTLINKRDMDALLAIFARYDYLKGKRVRVEGVNLETVGVANGVDRHFALKVITPEGEKALRSGEVTHVHLR